MTNLGYLHEETKNLDFAQSNSVANYLLGILSVVVTDKSVWLQAVNDAIRLEAANRLVRVEVAK